MREIQKLILPFSAIRATDAPSVGGKGASLGEMSSAGIPVPHGFVISTSAFERFLEETDLDVEVASQLSKLNIEDTKNVEETSRVLHTLLTNAAMPKDIEQAIVRSYDGLDGTPLVAVRSSATAEDSAAASWAGELETYLNTTRTTLLEDVKRCWASLYSPRALVYGCDRGFIRKNPNTKSQKLVCDVKVAVVVQEMVQSEVAGVAFTVHPVTKDRNQMIIEAVWGLGEALVSGQVTPDSYVLTKTDVALVDVHHAQQERQLARSAKQGSDWMAVAKAKQQKLKLNAGQVKKLAEICLGIEKHYGFPCDIEWAFCKGKFWITQSRPITTL